MCVVSMMIDSMQKQWPPIDQWDYSQAKDIQKIIEKIDALDKKIGAKECEDPEKAKFREEILKRIEAIEKSVAGILSDLG